MRSRQGKKWSQINVYRNSRVVGNDGVIVVSAVFGFNLEGTVEIQAATHDDG
jgi:hypothetical protein